jgi:hypothetical protein
LSAAVLKAGKADPVEHARLIAADFENGCRGSAIQEVDSAKLSLSFDEETANPMAGNAIEVIISAAKWKASDLDQAFMPTCQVPAQTEKSLPVPTKGIQTNCHGPAIRPQRLVAFILNRLAVPVLGWITAEKYGQGPGHPEPFSETKIGLSFGCNRAPIYVI